MKSCRRSQALTNPCRSGVKTCNSLQCDPCCTRSKSTLKYDSHIHVHVHVLYMCPPNLWTYTSSCLVCSQGIQITATTPTNSAVRLETSLIKLDMSNRVLSANTPLEAVRNKFKAFVQLDVSSTVSIATKRNFMSWIFHFSCNSTSRSVFSSRTRCSSRRNPSSSSWPPFTRRSSFATRCQTNSSLAASRRRLLPNNRKRC